MPCKHLLVYVRMCQCVSPSVSAVWSLLGAKGQTVCHREVSGYDEAELFEEVRHARGDGSGRGSCRGEATSLKVKLAIGWKQIHLLLIKLQVSRSVSLISMYS